LSFQKIRECDVSSSIRREERKPPQSYRTKKVEFLREEGFRGRGSERGRREGVGGEKSLLGDV